MPLGISISAELKDYANSLIEIFERAGLTDHSNALKYALFESEENLAKEAKYGSRTIQDCFDNIEELQAKVSAVLQKDKILNREVVKLFIDNEEKFEKVADTQHLPTYVYEQTHPMIVLSAQLLNGLRDKDDDEGIDVKDLELLILLNKSMES
jgi:hypothetical protein